VRFVLTIGIEASGDVAPIGIPLHTGARKGACVNGAGGTFTTDPAHINWSAGERS